MDDSAQLPAPAPAPLRRRPSLTTVRRAADVALALLWLIVVTGATVRLTGSGLGCPDWPSCNGYRPVPEASFHPLIEFSNRMIAFPVLIATVTSWVLARRHTPIRRDIRRASGLVVLGVLSEIVVGGVSVRMHLQPVAVSIHFLLNMVILMAATYASCTARRSEPVRLRVAGGTVARTSSLIMLVCAALVIAFGVMTTASGPHSGGLATQHVQRIGDWGLMVKVHARMAFVFFAIAVGLTVWHRRSRAGARDITLLTVLVGIQIALGEWQFRSGLPWGIVLAHVATATLLWIVTCLIAWDSCVEPVSTGPRVSDAADSNDTPDRSISSHA